MIKKELNAITVTDLNLLIENAITEGKTIEYKKELPNNSDSDKKEFLADVSSFSNTSGGDLIYGMTEEGGIPLEVVGVEVPDVDAEIRKYENTIRDGLEPRINFSTHVIKLETSKVIFIFRMSKSWLGPHRVTFKGHDKFYGRNSAGKYPLDVSELRTGFTLSQSLMDKIYKFKTERLLQLTANNTPIPFFEGAKMVLHLIPLESFTPTYKINLQTTDVSKLRPIMSSGWNHRINLEGIVTYTAAQNSAYTYVQAYRNGIIEMVNGSMLKPGDYGKIIPSKAYEERLISSLNEYLSFLKNTNVYMPIIVFLTFIGVKGYGLGVSSVPFSNNYTMDMDILQLPETIIESYDKEGSDILKPMFDLVWNAFGYERSMNFDEEGNWIKS